MSELQTAILEKVLDVVSNCVIVTDYRKPGNPIVFVNKAFEETTGYKKEEVLGLNPRFLHGEDRYQPGLIELSSAIASGRESKVSIKDYRKDKTAYWAEVSVFPVRDEQQNITHYVGVQKDLTALEANKLKSQFVANVTHEVRTPMSGVIGLLEMTLMEQNLQADVREALERALDASRELLSVLNGLLDFSRLEAGRMALSTESFSVKELVKNAVIFFQRPAADKGLDLDVFFDEELPESVAGDAAKIRQVLANLIDNAIKFSQKGKVEVSARLVSKSETEVEVRFSVADSGIGISDDAQKLFQPFVQADGSIRRQFGGTGLGLSIAKGFIELMGGKIGVDSAAGSGSTFWFMLQLKREQHG